MSWRCCCGDCYIGGHLIIDPGDSAIIQLKNYDDFELTFSYGPDPSVDLSGNVFSDTNPVSNVGTGTMKFGMSIQAGGSSALYDALYGPDIHGFLSSSNGTWMQDPGQTTELEYIDQDTRSGFFGYTGATGYYGPVGGWATLLRRDGDEKGLWYGVIDDLVLPAPIFKEDPANPGSCKLNCKGHPIVSSDLFEYGYGYYPEDVLTHDFGQNWDGEITVTNDSGVKIRVQYEGIQGDKTSEFQPCTKSTYFCVPDTVDFAEAFQRRVTSGRRKIVGAFNYNTYTGAAGVYHDYFGIDGLNCDLTAAQQLVRGGTKGYWPGSYAEQIFTIYSEAYSTNATNPFPGTRTPWNDINPTKAPSEVWVGNQSQQDAVAYGYQGTWQPAFTGADHHVGTGYPDEYCTDLNAWSFDSGIDDSHYSWLVAYMNPYVQAQNFVNNWVIRESFIEFNPFRFGWKWYHPDIPGMYEEYYFE